MCDKNLGKTYTISAAASLLGAVRRVLVDAVPPSIASSSPMSSYGWITGACAEPGKGDHYIVEFLGKREYRILAYVDRHGRVFATDCPLTSPPAREPDLRLTRFTEQPIAGEQRGFVEVVDTRGAVREVAQYVCKREHYTLFDSWYNFGALGSDLSYDDVLARAYLAFVYRPEQGGSEVPTRGLGFVRAHLNNEDLLTGLRQIVEGARAAESDPLVNPPALVRTIARWLDDAGIALLTKRKVPTDALRLVRPDHYSDMLFITLEENQQNLISRHEVWALESALNRFLLVEEAFGEGASVATDADCARWDTYLIETVGMQTPSVEHADGQPVGVEGGEWETRCRIGAAFERCKFPVRVEMNMRMSVAEGIVAFELTVPDALLMPAWFWKEGPPCGWCAVPQEERNAQARRYAMHVGLVLASVAFETSHAITSVDVTARPLEDKHEKDELGGDSDKQQDAGKAEFPLEQLPAYYKTTITRQIYQATDCFRAAVSGDPLPQFIQMDAAFDVVDVKPFSDLYTPLSAARNLLPEAVSEALPLASQEALGAESTSGVRIVVEAYQRRIGEKLADGIVRAQSTSEAIRLVREAQDAAETRGDDRMVSACTRLMTMLAEGTLDVGDQNSIVSCFLGEDRCLAALVRARGLVQIDPKQAVSVLIDAVAEAAALDGFADGATTVHRSFESYAARVLYNRALAAAHQTRSLSTPAQAASSVVPTLASCAQADAGKRLQLVSDSFYLCHLEIVNMLERSFDHIDDAIRYGKRTVELAPSVAMGYRQLARAYMLVGDMNSAVSVLAAGLQVAIQPHDIAAAYYQLAYVLWKAGSPRAGAACYLKSVTVSPMLVSQALVELKELVTEHGIVPIEQSEIDSVLREEGVVVAPTVEVLEMLEHGAVAATDAGLFTVAHNLLSLRVRYVSDDALVHVVRSLEGLST